MTAYLVLTQEIHDLEGYRSEYVPRVGPLLRKHGAQILVAGSDQQAAEGEPPNTVVIRFPDTRRCGAF